MTTRADHGPSTHREDRDGSPEDRRFAEKSLHVCLLFESEDKTMAEIDDDIRDHCWRGKGNYFTSTDFGQLSLALSRAMVTLGSVTMAHRETARRLEECQRAYTRLLKEKKGRVER